MVERYTRDIVGVEVGGCPLQKDEKTGRYFVVRDGQRVDLILSTYQMRPCVGFIDSDGKHRFGDYLPPDTDPVLYTRQSGDVYPEDKKFYFVSQNTQSPSKG